MAILYYCEISKDELIIAKVKEIGPTAPATFKVKIEEKIIYEKNNPSIETIKNGESISVLRSNIKTPKKQYNSYSRNYND